MVTLKKATEKDIPFLVSLRNRTMKPHIENEGMEYISEDQHARVMFSFENSRIIVHDNKNIGLLKVDKSAAPWKIIQIQLLPEFQNRGIGTRLLREITKESDAAGCSVELNVLKGNKAQGLYKKLGFELFEEKAHAYIMLRTPSGLTDI